MKTNNHFFKTTLVLFMATALTGFGLFSSCKKDDNAKPDQPDILKFESTAEPSSGTVDTKATGNLTAQYDPATKKLSYTFNWENLSGEIGGFHIHQGDGSVIINFKDDGYSTAVTGTFSGSTILTEDAWIQDLEAGKLYGQIHTAQYPSGELIFPFTQKSSSAGNENNDNPPSGYPPVY